MLYTLPAGTAPASSFSKLIVYTINSINRGSNPVFVSFLDYGTDCHCWCGGGLQVALALCVRWLAFAVSC